MPRQTIPPHPQRQPPPPPSPPQREPPPSPKEIPTAALPSSSSSTTVVPQRSSKPIFNRLNPMSLLGRRRSSQAANQANDIRSLRKSVIPGPDMPDDFDPRIRGKKVHDFSAPRPRRLGSSLDLVSIDTNKEHGSKSGSDGWTAASQNLGDNLTSLASAKRHSDYGPDSSRQHTPVFKEHFDEEIDTWRFDQNDRRNQNTTGIVDRVPTQDPGQGRSPLPPFAKNFPNDVSDPLLLSNASLATSPTKPTLSSVVGENASSNTKLQPPSISSTSTPSRARSRAASTTDPCSPPSSMPKRLKSNSSRFSFDLAGVGSAAQEKLLEDKHRQKTAQRTRSSTVSGLSISVTDDGSFHYDDIDFEDGLEERIPGINTDDDCEAIDDEWKKGSEMSTSTLLLDNNPSQDLYLKAQDEELSLRTSRNADSPMTQTPVQTQHAALHGQTPSMNTSLYSLQNTGFQSIFQDHQNRTALHDLGIIEGSASDDSRNSPSDDDLYFDDGMIEDLDLRETATFDESVFDDEDNRVYGLRLRELPALAGLPEVETSESSRQSTRPISIESGAILGNNQGVTADTSRTSVYPPENGLAGRKTSLRNPGTHGLGYEQSAELTHDNLAAYHDALALAANKAVLEGRFEREASHEETDEEPANSDARPRVSFSDEPLNRLEEPNSMEDYEATDDLDDCDGDDDIIAAANAEALENDNEGIYGREFGFFAQSSSTEAQYAMGGYFGPQGMNGIKRSHSGRVNGAEPSLTPITERSEWSQRNSMVSLATHGAHGSLTQPMQTPGLAQLADSMQYEDDNMSLSALMKLRRGAWGASDVSLPSSAGSLRGGSPQLYGAQSPPPTASSVGPSFHAQNSSIGSNNSAGFESDPIASKSRPLTVQTNDLVLPPPTSAGSDVSPIRRNAIKGHSRNSSGAESVSYVREKDEDGGRWVVEKRRTGEGGVMEVLGREVLDSGRI